MKLNSRYSRLADVRWRLVSVVVAAACVLLAENTSHAVRRSSSAPSRLGRAVPGGGSTSQRGRSSEAGSSGGSARRGRSPMRRQTGGGSATLRGSGGGGTGAQAGAQQIRSGMARTLLNRPAGTRRRTTTTTPTTTTTTTSNNIAAVRRGGMRRTLAGTTVPSRAGRAGSPSGNYGSLPVRPPQYGRVGDRGSVILSSSAAAAAAGGGGGAAAGGQSQYGGLVRVRTGAGVYPDRRPWRVRQLAAREGPLAASADGRLLRQSPRSGGTYDNAAAAFGAARPTTNRFLPRRRSPLQQLTTASSLRRSGDLSYRSSSNDYIRLPPPPSQSGSSNDYIRLPPPSSPR